MRRRVVLIKKLLQIACLAIFLFCITVAICFVLWLSTWQKHDDFRGFSLKYPKNWNLQMNDGLLSPAVDNRQALITLQEIHSDNRGGENSILFYRFVQFSLSSRGAEGLISKYQGYFQDSGLFRNVKRTTGHIDGKPTSILTLKHVPEDSSKSLEGYYFIETPNFVYDVDSFTYYEGLSPLDLLYHRFIMKLVIHSFRFTN